MGGYKESYSYWTDVNLKLPLYGAPVFAGDMWITANLIQAMVYDQDWAYKSYHEPFFRSKFASLPKLSGVNFPEIVVSKAVFDESANSLNFELAINAPTDDGKDQVKIETMG